MYRKLLSVAVSISFIFQAEAQNSGIGVSFGGYDFYGPQTKSYLLSSQKKYSYDSQTQTSDTSTKDAIFWSPMIKISYWHTVSRHIDLSLGLSIANVDYPTQRPDSSFINSYRYKSGNRDEKFLGELDARFQYNFTSKDKYPVSPYFLSGLTLAYHDIYWGLNIPLGLGANIRVAKGLSLNLESVYKISGSDHDQNHLQHSAGFVFWFGKRSQGYSPLVEVQKDSDGDGVADEEDNCPSIAGDPELGGCPDTDEDGLADDEDDCPLMAGSMALNGCPDTDKDGIPDDKDDCPTKPGPADKNGCPVTDRDGDGYPDSEDKCPSVYSKTNGGCPEIAKEVVARVEKAGKSVYFESGTSRLKKESMKSLDQIVSVLKADQTLMIDISGHTDNSGDAEKNRVLSQKRAEACGAYLISKGISAKRITAKGFGETKPVADNKTVSGKSRNRRTEFRIRNN